MCFSLAWLGNLLIWIVIICAVFALLRLLVGFIMPRLGVGADVINVVAQAIHIVIWAIVAIALIVFIFDLIACLGPSVPRLGR